MNHAVFRVLGTPNTGLPRVALMLCGHTHGGQIRPFGRAMVTHVRNPRYVSGLVEGPGFPMYISRGLGLGGLPIRYGADPELTILTLRSQGGTSPQAGTSVVCESHL